MSEPKKQGFFSKLFSSKSQDALLPAQSESQKKPRPKTSTSSSSSSPTHAEAPALKPKPKPAASAPSTSAAKKPTKSGTGKKGKSLKRRKTKKAADIAAINVNAPLDYPATPELILAHHKRKAFLTKNEEWLVVELNEYECLVDSLDTIKTIAKHSQFFEVEPDELWEEFFEFVEEVPSYDEVINLDVWQEFRDEKYPC